MARLTLDMNYWTVIAVVAVCVTVALCAGRC